MGCPNSDEGQGERGSIVLRYSGVFMQMQLIGRPTWMKFSVQMLDFMDVGSEMLELPNTIIPRAKN